MSRPAPAIAHLAIAALIFIAAWSPVDALPAVDAVVPEPASGQTVFDPHAEAVATFQFLQAQGKDENDCAAFADSIISDVNKRISDGQDFMNGLSDGSECAAEGQEDMTNAKTDLDDKKQTRDQASQALTTAQKASVDFLPFNLDKLQVGQCNQFYNSAEYKAAITTRTNAETAKTQADDAVVGAQTVLDNAITTTAELKNECLCDAKKAHDSAWEAVQEVVGTNEKEWAKAQHLKCVAAGTAADDCNVPGVPTVDDKPLVGEAANAECIDKLARANEANEWIKKAAEAWVANREEAETEYGHISQWHTEHVTDMSKLFYYASNFNEDISGWDVSAVTTMDSIFYGASSFNQDLSTWDTSAVTNMGSIFRDATNFNQDLSGWDVSAVTNMEDMFYNANSFNQDLSGWDVSAVTDMGDMFNNANSFNQDLSGWDVSAVTKMNYMFAGASSFDQDLSGWNVSAVTNMSYMFNQASRMSNVPSWCSAALWCVPAQS